MFVCACVHVRACVCARVYVAEKRIETLKTKVGKKMEKNRRGVHRDLQKPISTVCAHAMSYETLTQLGRPRWLL